MSRVRPPSVAGMFYPAEPSVLATQIQALMAGAATESYAAKAMIAPHAGYPYSGPVAASAYAAVRDRADRIERVVLIGPAHRFAIDGIAVPDANGLATPLGTVPVDTATVAVLCRQRLVACIDRAFDGEHALEVHLPFLQTLFGDFRVVPLLVGRSTPEQVVQVLAACWGGDETLVIVSSDLSHFLDYAAAQRLDAATTRAFESLQGSGLTGRNACGHLPVSGLLRHAGALDMRATTLDRRNSGDTAGGRDRVVGYGAYVFEYATAARLDSTLRQRLLTLARLALEHGVRQGEPLPVETPAHPPPLRALRKTFVTLELDGALRGCVGSVVPHKPLVEDVVANVFKASRQDPRFAPVTEAEAAHMDISISILSHPRPIAFRSESDLVESLNPDVDGLILRDGDRQSLFLPKVWRSLPDPRQFVRHLKLKAGLPADHESPNLQGFRFMAESFAAPATSTAVDVAAAAPAPVPALQWYS